MVTPDWNAGSKPKTTVSFVPAEAAADNSLFARPLDRLAAVIVDMFVVLAPLYILFSAPIKKWMTLSFLIGNEADFVSNVFGMVGIAVLLIVAYQTLMHYFFKATIGKLLFDLRLVSMFPGHKVSLWDCFMRSWVWSFEVLCFALPLLSVFSNSKRRPWHDRICDTLVISRTQSGVLGPAPWEQALVKGFFAVFIALFLLSSVVAVKESVDKLKAESHLAALIDRETAACEQVSRVLPEESEKPHARLEMAMTLYAAGLAQRECLEAEVERELIMQIPVGPVTYLAQAFVHADDADISNSYLDEVCETAPGSVECHMSQVVSRWSEEDWSAVAEWLQKAPRGSGYLEVWGVRHFMKQAEYGKALGLMDSLLSSQFLSEFSMVQRVKGLYNAYREPEAEAALLQAISALAAPESRQISSWMCAQQLQSGCAALEKPACRQLVTEGEQTTEIDFEESNEALARVLALECKNEGKIDYLSFADAVKDDDWQTFFRANLKREKNDKDASAHLFSQLIFSSEAPELLKIEAARRWSQFANGTQSQELFEQWRVMESKEVWVKTGNFMLRRMSETGQADLALRTARYLMNYESLSPQSLASLSAMLDPKKPTQQRQPASLRERVRKLTDEGQGE